MENALTIRNLDDVQTAAQIFITSGYFKEMSQLAQASVKIIAGQELGIPPIAAMRGIDIVEGQISIRSHLMAAMIKKSGRYDYKVLDNTVKGATIEYFDKGESMGVSTFDESDAKAAGLDGRQTWRKFPKAMYYNRAMSQGARMYCPDIFLGAVYDEGEIEVEKPVDPPSPRQLAFLRDLLEHAGHADDDIERILAEVPTRDDASKMITELRSGGQVAATAPAKKKTGLVFAAEVDDNNNFTGNFTDGDGNYVDVPDEPDDIPEPETPAAIREDVTKAQFGKLMGLFTAAGVVEGDKRDLLTATITSKASASQAIDHMVKAETLPDNVFLPYVKILRERAGITFEDVKDYCEAYFEQSSPANLDTQQQRQLINWLSIVQEYEGGEEQAEEMDRIDAWRKGAHVSDEMYASMSDIEIEKSVDAWEKRQAGK